MPKLNPQTSYKVTSMIVSSKNVVYNLGTQIYTTLKDDFQPETIQTISIEGYYKQTNINNQKIGVIFKWEPARDETCKYSFITHDPDSDEGISVVKKNYPEIFHHYKEIPFGSLINVAVRGQNHKRPDLESEIYWVSLKVDTCMEVYNNTEFCGPEKFEIHNFSSEIVNVNEDNFKVKLSWDPPSYEPDNYTLKISDVNPEISMDGTPKFYSFNIKGVS